MNRMQNAAQRMQALINGLLQYSRVTSKAQPFEVTNLEHIIREVVSDLELYIEKLKGKITWNSLPIIEADPVQIRQLFQNLLTNALKFQRPELSPVVNVSSETISLTDEYDTDNVRHDEYCKIVFEDNGIGFEEKYLDRIFTVFQRLHGRTQYEGMGLGLAICRKIVERHRGIITAKSSPGRGTAFIVMLPLSQSKRSK